MNIWQCPYDLKFKTATNKKKYFSCINIDRATVCGQQMETFHTLSGQITAKPGVPFKSILMYLLYIGIPLKTTMDHCSTVQITGLIHNLVHKARNTVRELDSQNDLTFLRLRSKKHEIMCAPGKCFCHFRPVWTSETRGRQPSRPVSKSDWIFLFFSPRFEVAFIKSNISVVCFGVHDMRKCS